MTRQTVNTLAAIVTALVLAAIAPPRAMGVDDLSLIVAPGSESVMPGDTVTVSLDIANLSTAVNGVQALMHFDDTLLMLVDVVPIDLGLVLPADGWVEVEQVETNGDLDYAVVVKGGSTIANGAVATLIFTAIGEGTTSVTFRADSSPFFTKIIRADNNGTIFPNTFASGVIEIVCDDGLFCNGVDVLVGGVCEPGVPPDCSLLADDCNDGVCNEAADACEAQPANEGFACDDGDLCTEGDSCTSGVCGSTPVDCSFLDDPCNLGTCDAATGLCEALPANEGGSCDDGAFCNGTDTCNAGVCVSTGDPCLPLFCDETNDVCLAPVHVDKLEVFYAGWFLDQGDSSRSFLAGGSVATAENVTNYIRGITGVRVSFDNVVSFATSADAAFSFEWTNVGGVTFSPVTDAGTAITVTSTVLGGVTVVDIVLADRHVRQRWLKVMIDSTQITSGGAELDGELVGNPVILPSGDAIPGGDAVFYLGNMSGDVSGDRKTTLTDIGQLRLQVNPAFSVSIDNIFDLDKSGKVQLADVGQGRLDVNPALALPLISP